MSQTTPIVHLVRLDTGPTVCCDRSVFELPITERVTSRTADRTCPGPKASDADQSPPPSRVDPSRLPVGGDLSRAVVELPDDGIETLCRSVGHALATHPRITGSALAALANADGETAVELRERVLTVIAAAAYSLIAAGVRAEALREAADEVQREQRTVREHQALGFDPAGRLAILENLLRARARAASGELEPAACTCPRADESAWTHYCGATEPGSEREFDPECPQHGQCAGPVATPTEPADPTHGRIDADIQRAVEAMEPESIGQRVAIENTLQARRDAAPAGHPEVW